MCVWKQSGVGWADLFYLAYGKYMLLGRAEKGYQIRKTFDLIQQGLPSVLMHHKIGFNITWTKATKKGVKD